MLCLMHRTVRHPSFLLQDTATPAPRHCFWSTAQQWMPPGRSVLVICTLTSWAIRAHVDARFGIHPSHPFAHWFLCSEVSVADCGAVVSSLMEPSVVCVGRCGASLLPFLLCRPALTDIEKLVCQSLSGVEIALYDAQDGWTPLFYAAFCGDTGTAALHL